MGYTIFRHTHIETLGMRLPFEIWWWLLRNRCETQVNTLDMFWLGKTGLSFWATSIHALKPRWEPVIGDGPLGLICVFQSNHLISRNLTIEDCAAVKLELLRYSGHLGDPSRLPVLPSVYKLSTCTWPCTIKTIELLKSQWKLPLPTTGAWKTLSQVPRLSFQQMMWRICNSNMFSSVRTKNSFGDDWRANQL